MNNWRLEENIYVFFTWNGRGVYLADPTEKKYWGRAKYLSKSTVPPTLIQNRGIKVKIDEGKFKILTERGFQEILNLDTYSLAVQLSGITITEGEATGISIGFSTTDPTKVGIFQEGKKLYKELESEQQDRVLRKLLVTKTKKLIPGHRYSNTGGKSDSFIYLGKFTTRGTSGIGDVECFYMGKQKYPSMKDIWKEYFSLTSENMIIFKSYLTSSTYDLGIDEGFVLDSISPEEAFSDVLEKYMQTESLPTSLGSKRVYWKTPGNLIKRAFVTSSPAHQYSSDISTKISKIIKDNMIFKLDEIHTRSTNFKEDLTNYILTSLFGSINSRERDFLKVSLNDLFGIDVESLSKEVIGEYDTNKELNTFEDLIENFNYLKNKYPEDFHKNIDMVAYPKKPNFKDWYKKKDSYTNLIFEIYKEALETFGGNIEYFSIHNVGTDTKPIPEYSIMITLQDILNYYKVNSPFELPEDIKKSILEKKTYEVSIRTRKNEAGKY